MRTLDDAINQFAYHPATPEVSATFAQLRKNVIECAEKSWSLIPDGPEKTLAMRGLQQFLMHANLAVAMTTPADFATPDVARVLPQSATGRASCSCGEQMVPTDTGTLMVGSVEHRRDAPCREAPAGAGG